MRPLDYAVLRGGKLENEDDLANALWMAVANARSDVVRALLDAGADPNRVASGTSAEPALIKAAKEGHEEIARLLIARGALIRATDSQGWNALLHAVYLRRTGVVQVLLPAWPELTLLEAAALGDDRTVRQLLSRGVPPEDRCTTETATTPLELAAKGGHLEVVRLLLERGADANAPDGRALIAALGSGHLDIAREFLERGARPSQPVVEEIVEVLECTGMEKEREALNLLDEFGVDLRTAME